MSERMFDSAARERLLAWYAAGHRNLPWRQTRDPYYILVSEVMLQQTQAERVEPKYHAFLEQFPTLQTLADAPASAVIRAWSGLGYNRRALQLHRACRAVVAEHGGVMPRTIPELLLLPGVGPYTARAVACFAWEADVAFVDTNIRRVLQRVVAGPELAETRLSEREINRVAAESLPTGRAYAWNQALMELGATLCRARTVACATCPLETDCAARPTIEALLARTPGKRGTGSERFEESSRFFRGRIIAALGDTPAGLTLAELGVRLRPTFSAIDAAWLVGLMDGLSRDGLVTRACPPGLQEDPARYDERVDLMRVYRLPD